MSETAKETRNFTAILKAAGEARKKWEAIRENPNHTSEERRAGWESFMSEVTAIHTVLKK